MKKIFTVVVFLFAISIPYSSLGAVHYVRAGASGSNDGSDWINAYTQLPDSLVRGDVYYVAGGSYGGYEFDDAVSGTLTIEIKKAIASDHGTDTGWQAAYGSEVAVFQGNLKFSSDYWIFNGQTGGGPNQWTTGFGFEVRIDWSSAGRGGSSAAYFSKGVGHVEVRHVEFNPIVAHESFGTIFYGFDVHDVVLSHIYAHDIFGTFFTIRNWSNALIEYNYFRKNLSTSEWHAEAISDGGSDDITIRFNQWVDIDGTAVFAVINSFGPSDRWDIYGNLFYCTDQSSEQFVSGVIRVINDKTNNASANDWKFHHNTVANLEGWFGGGILIDAGSNNVARNNIWWANGTLNRRRMLFRGIDLDYNLYDVSQGSEPKEANGQYLRSSPFKNFASFDFELAHPTDPGAILGPPYDVDVMGRVRGNDTVIDRGALEQEGVPNSLAPARPGKPELIATSP